MYKFSLLLYSLSALSAVYAQSSVPSDLSSAFDSSQIALQVSYDNKAEFGFKDGTQFTSQQTSQAPVFALGDASGINTALTFMIMMVDTTDDNKRVLHFLQPGFKANGDETAISSTSQPIQAYKAPGSLGDSGLRKYSFLMYSQPKSFSASGMPSAGSTFNVEDFMKANNLQAALAGIGMQVQMSGSSAPPAPSSAQSASAPAAPPPSTLTTAPAPPQVSVPPVSVNIPAISSAAASDLSSLGSQASQAVGSASAALSQASVAASSALASGSAAVASLTASAAGVGSTASAAAGNATVPSLTAPAGSSSTSSAAGIQSSSNAVAHRGSAFASLPLFMFAWVVLA